jgi:hypothetical protein
VLTGVVLVSLVLAACAPVAGPSLGGGATPGLLQAPPSASVAVAPDLHLLRGPVPFPFEENRGQAPDDIAYLLRAGAMQVGFGQGGPRFHLTDRPACDPAAVAGLSRRGDDACADPEQGQARAHSVALELVGATDARPAGTVPSDTLISYFKGTPDQWLVGVPAFQHVAYPAAWPGIDVRYERATAGLDASYLLAPGADPSLIRLAWHGAERATLGEDGALTLTTPVGTLREVAPVAWQDGFFGQRTVVPVRFDLLSDGADGLPAEVGFALGTYDPSRALTIDPVIAYAGYIGGDVSEVAHGVAVDSSGAAYLGGQTDSNDGSFPVLGGPDLTHNNPGVPFQDAWVAKVKPDGSGLVYAGFIGGTQSDVVYAIAVDGNGAAYVTGSTASDNASFPVVVGPDLTFNGSQEAWVAKVKPDGSGLVYAGYVGNDDDARGIAVDSSGAAYIAGFTRDSLPVAVGPDLTFNGGVIDAFVAKVKPDGSGLVYCGFVGGDGDDVALDVAVDGSGAAYVTGHTDSTQATFPVQTGPDLTFNGGTSHGLGDAFVAKVRPDGSGFVFAGYIGGSGNDTATGIAVDTSGAAYVVGDTDSTENSFPVKVGPDLTFNGDRDLFVAKVKPDGSGLTYAGYIGGSKGEAAFGIAVDGSGAAYVSGLGTAGFPVVGSPPLNQGSGLFAKVKPDGTDLVFAGRVGGNNNDQPQAIAVDSTGAVYLSGLTPADQSTFPVKVGPDLTYNGGEFDAMVIKIVDVTATVTPTPIGGAATATPTQAAYVAPPEDDTDKHHKLSDDQKRTRQHTNQYNADHYDTSGNVAGVEQTPDGLLITLAQIRNETQIVAYRCGDHCPTIPLGANLSATGEVGDDGRFEATDIDLSGR